MPRRCRDSVAVVLPRWCWAGRSPRQICPSIVPWLPPAVFGHRLKCSPGHPVPFLENTVPVSEDFPHSNDCNDSNDDYFHFSLSLSFARWYTILYDFPGEWRRIAHWPGIFVWSFLGARWGSWVTFLISHWPRERLREIPVVSCGVGQPDDRWTG